MARTYRQLVDLLERILPRRLFLALYGSNACLACARILWRGYGFARSAFRWESRDARGRPIPWFAYPATEYLDQLDLSGRRVFEFGCGFSSLYWSEKAKTLVSVEDDPGWHGRIKRELPSNARLVLATEPDEYAGAVLKEEGPFEIIVIDGNHRLKCAQNAVEKLAESGVVILDDADDHPDAANFLRGQDLLEVDFAGFNPINSCTKTTSFFFRSAFRPPYADSASPRHPIGHPAAG
jgi:hypothetical protein